VCQAGVCTADIRSENLHEWVPLSVVLNLGFSETHRARKAIFMRPYGRFASSTAKPECFSRVL
jgi:hypothetical protein